MELVTINQETFHDTAKALPPPVTAFLICIEDNQDIILFYLDEMEEAA